MSDKVFLDTNIIIYAHTDHDVIKQGIAQAIMIKNDTFISTQVLQETANILKKKLKHPYTDISKVLADLIANTSVHVNSTASILKACEIAGQYGFSFYDSLIISAALEAGANILYSEDMQHSRLIENSLEIINPFL